MYSTFSFRSKTVAADETILGHIKPLARMTGAKLLLVHVSDGWVARNFDQLKLAESEEMKQDRAYLEKRQPGIERRRFFLRCRSRARRAVGRDHQTGAGEGCRSHRHEHARPPFHQRYSLRRDCRQSASRGERSGVAAARRKITSALRCNIQCCAI